MMTKLNTILSMMTMAAMTAACSVQQRAVVNEPPKFDQLIAKDSQKPGEQPEGQMGPVKLQSVSVFYWPEGLDELQAQTLVRTVNTASEEVDKLTTEIQGLQRQIKTLEAEFEAEKCVETWADLDPDQDSDFVDWVEKWKTVSANDPDFQNKSAAREKCINNQDQRKDLPRKVDEIVSKKLPVQIGTIYKSIDPGYPDKVENMKSVNAKVSTLIIPVAGAPKITLVDFMRPGNTQTTEVDEKADQATKDKMIFDAKYSPSTKLLTFKVPELDAAGHLTGSVLVFALERAPDFLLQARFSGKVRLMSRDGQILRYGRAKFEGCMTDKCKKAYK